MSVGSLEGKQFRKREEDEEGPQRCLEGSLKRELYSLCLYFQTEIFSLREIYKLWVKDLKLCQQKLSIRYTLTTPYSLLR